MVSLYISMKWYSSSLLPSGDMFQDSPADTWTPREQWTIYYIYSYRIYVCIYISYAYIPMI
jgi:hypothetical protein